MAFHQHFLHDTYKLTENMKIDWEVNKSWREVSGSDNLFDDIDTVTQNILLIGSTTLWIITHGTIQ
jgi:hypothetical protein